MRVKTVSIVGIKYHHGQFTECETVIDGKVVVDISISSYLQRMRITMKDVSGIVLKELYVPDTFIVEVTYKNIEG